MKEKNCILSLENDFFSYKNKNVFVSPLPWCVKNEFEIKKMQKMNENKKIHKS